MTWKTLIHGDVPGDCLENSAVQNPHQQIKRPEDNAHTKPPVSDEAIILKMQHIIERVIEQARDEYGYQFNATEAARQINYIDGIVELSPLELDDWAATIVTRMIQARGQIPKGWDKVARCVHCGPVWCPNDIDKLRCGWCDLREAGETFPQPNQ
jgi:hypothetical protein